MTSLARIPTVRDLINALLDKGYSRATAQVTRAIVRNSTDGLIAQRLKELETEAARLEVAGQKLSTSNPIYRALMADLETILKRDAALIDAVAPDVANVGIDAARSLTRQLALPGMTDQQLQAVGVRWNTPDPEAVTALVNYTGKSEWTGLLDKYASGISDTVNGIGLRGIVDGKGSLATAREMRRTVEGLPASTANNLMRTLQLTSYRDATAIHQLANADILEEQIRIATLDARTCMACIALHGTRLRLGERVDDHHSGRCTSIAVVKGRPRDVRSGEAWFNAQPPAAQEKQMGKAAFAALQDGAISLKDFPKPYKDPVFGPMVREASLKGILGDGATRYYQSQEDS